MIEIKVNDEVRDVEAQVWLGLTVRQVVLLATGLFIGVFVGLFLYRKTPIDLFQSENPADLMGKGIG